MLVTRQKVLRRFWYAIMPMTQLDAGPQPFTRALLMEVG
jgi:hypothetical protein